jgi:DNA polymerase alpha subunit A
VNIDATFEALMNEFEDCSDAKKHSNASHPLAQSLKTGSDISHGPQELDDLDQNLAMDASIGFKQKGVNFGLDTVAQKDSSDRLDSAGESREGTKRSLFFAKEKGANSVPVRSISMQGKVDKRALMQQVVLPTTASIQDPIADSILNSNLADSLKDMPVNSLIPNNSSLSPLVPSEEGLQYMNSDGSCAFYWLDAYERSNGDVLLLGKVYDAGRGLFGNACVAVSGLLRTLYFVPRETVNDEASEAMVSVTDLHAEVASELARAGVRRYAFEVPDMPSEAEYLKVQLPYHSTSALKLPESGKTFSRVFGVPTSALETLLIKRRLMGPSWLKLKGVQVARSKLSWSRYELSVTNPKDVTVLADDHHLPLPTLTMMSISLKTVFQRATQTTEIVAVALHAYSGVQIDGPTSTLVPTLLFHGVRPVDPAAPLPLRDLMAAFEKIRLKGGATPCANEKALMTLLLSHIERVDPDVIVGHALTAFDLPVLLHRLKALKVSRWSRVGRLQWATWPQRRTFLRGAALGPAERQILAGRLLCDTYTACKDVVRAKNYTLKELAATQLGLTKEDLDVARIPSLFQSPEGVAYVLRHTEMDAHLAAQLAIKLMLLPLSKQLTTLAGNLWRTTLLGARAERNEYLLLHAFHDAKFIVPDKSVSARQDSLEEHDEEGEEGEDRDTAPHPNNMPAVSSRRKPAYAGGLVLAPQTGLYDAYVLLLDFNSLYPSIIQEFNICFTTVTRTTDTEIEPSLPDKDVPPGILPKLLAQLVARRRQVKQLMEDVKERENCKEKENKDNTNHRPDVKDVSKGSTQSTKGDAWMALDIRQKALKLTANSMYGCLGYPRSRFYAKPLAMLITAKGRAILQATVDLATSSDTLSLQVIYGDTDSIMIHTGSHHREQALQMAQALKKMVNAQYKLLEIDVDGESYNVLSLIDI